MNGLLRRLTRRRAATADEPPPDSPAASEPVDATVVSQEEGPALSEEERAREEELRRRRRDLPAGLDADRLEQRPGEGARRGALRHRVRFLQATRELLLRDLGGFTYEVHRAAGASHGGHRDIIERKAERLAAIDEELRAHEAALGLSGPAATVVRQPGIGGTCPACGELHGSDAGWCAYCGTPLTERARKRADEATERAIEDSRRAEAERAAAAQAAAAPAAADHTDEPSEEHKRALLEYTGRHKAQPAPEQPAEAGDAAGAEQPAAEPDPAPAPASEAGSGPAPKRKGGRRSSKTKPAAGEQPTTDLGEPVTSEHRQ